MHANQLLGPLVGVSVLLGLCLAALLLALAYSVWRSSSAMTAASPGRVSRGKSVAFKRRQRQPVHDSKADDQQGWVA